MRFITVRNRQNKRYPILSPLRGTPPFIIEAHSTRDVPVEYTQSRHFQALVRKQKLEVVATGSVSEDKTPEIVEEPKVAAPDPEPELTPVPVFADELETKDEGPPPWIPSTKRASKKRSARTAPSSKPSDTEG